MFQPLLDESQLYDGLMHPCEISGKALLLICHHDEVYVVDRFCPHQQFLLDKAAITPRGALICPRHHFHFQLGTGECAEGRFHLTHYPVARQDGKVGVELAQPPSCCF